MWLTSRPYRPRPRRPRVEPLEDRSVPAAFIVTTTLDAVDPGDGLLSLREAIQNANAAAGADAIDFAVTGTITLTGGQLDIADDLSVAGPGAATLAVSGNAASRVFAVAAGTTVTMSGLTVTGGLATDGAGIRTAGHLTLRDVVMSGNVAQGAAAGGNAFGGGIYNDGGTLVITRSKINENRAVAGDGGLVGTPVTLPGGSGATLLGVAGGGAVWNDGGSLTVINSSLGKNFAQGGSGGDARGSPAAFPFVGTAVGGAIGSGSFFSTALPALTIAGSSLTGNRALGGSNVFASSGDAGTGRGGALGAVEGGVSVSDGTFRGNLAKGGDRFRFEIDFLGSLFIQEGGSGAFGGGIYADNFSAPTPPTLQITGGAITGNVARGGGLSAGGSGGGLYSNAVNVQMSDSTVSGNQAIGSTGGGFTIFFGRTSVNGGGLSSGGGINTNGGTLTIGGSTVKDNLARGGPGAPAAPGGNGGTGFGGGILYTGPAFALTDSTLRGNQAVGGDSTAGAAGGDAQAGGLALSNFETVVPATITGTTLADNAARGGSGGTVFGGSATGGAASITFTDLQMTDCTVLANRAVGAAGAAGSSGRVGGRGGQAFGAGLHISEGSRGTVAHTTFVRNEALGGAGGAGGAGAAGGAGGRAVAGGLIHTLAAMTVSDSSFVRNRAQGGPGGTGAAGGAGGIGQGGAIWNVLAFGSFPPFVSSLTVRDSSINQNQAVGGAGGAAGAGGVGGRGGNADGGGITNTRIGITGQVRLTLVGSNVNHNIARGGAGADGGVGGNARGAALFLDVGTTAELSECNVHHSDARGGAGSGDGSGGSALGGGIHVATGSTLTVRQSQVKHNRAVGGAGGTTGTAGQGIGGGVYNLGTFFLDADSDIDHNDASTSEDNVFGPVTQI